MSKRVIFRNADGKRHTGMRFLLLAFLLCLSCGRSFASTCSGTVQTFTLTLPSSISVPRDAPVGSLLTNWVYSTSSTNLWSCSANNDAAGVSGKVGPSFTVSSGVTYGSGPGGASVNVYQTNIPGVGIALAGSLYHGYAGWTSWNGFNTSWGGPVFSPLSGTFPMGGQIAVALVKTGAVTASGTIASSTVLQLAPYTSSGAQSGQADSYVITAVNVVPMSCTTPDVNVPMGTFTLSDFPAVGSLSPRPAAFNIQLLNCPAGVAVSGTQSGTIHSVMYRIDPTNGLAATNVAKLSGSPTAAGVGIQLFTSTGSVFPLASLQTLSGFSGTAGGNYTIPMTARYYRTGTVSAGPANTTMTLTVSYQ
ncbi:type-1 fimbrial protein subunit A [Caballeronia pedi]|uniref:Type-1 fimbrial protein subunit A n=1 Tax=Caballeronia pedi TaxID=1777141 RepID=A0A157ZA28_9BURK|nr:fimbrial protein [Caballeronia pedi]SAK42402.1 type-1 fimbrial protein subunit A [Caballeronia pedi]